MRYYMELATELEELDEKDHSYRVLGELKLSVAADPEQDLRAKLAQRQRVIDSFGSEGSGSNDLIGASAIREICPLLEGVELADLARPDRQRGRDEVPQGAAERMQKVGGRHVQGSAELRLKTGRVEGVDVDREFLPCDTVILANGSWANQTLDRLGLTSDVYSMRVR